jgi:hypothetical protein
LSLRPKEEEEEEEEESCRIQMRDESFVQNFNQKCSKERSHLAGISVYRRIILK